MEETLEKKIILTIDKVQHLIGANGENLRLIEKQCGCHIQVINNISEIGVLIKCTTEGKSFNNEIWAKYLHCYLKNATRGGFIQKISHAEFHEFVKMNNGNFLDLEEGAYAAFQNRFRVCFE